MKKRTAARVVTIQKRAARRAAGKGAPPSDREPTDKRLCPSCGAPIGDGASPCAQCGWPVVELRGAKRPSLPHERLSDDVRKALGPAWCMTPIYNREERERREERARREEAEQSRSSDGGTYGKGSVCRDARRKSRWKKCCTVFKTALLILLLAAAVLQAVKIRRLERQVSQNNEELADLRQILSQYGSRWEEESIASFLIALPDREMFW